MDGKFILMGIEYNDIWQYIDFFVKEDDEYGLIFADNDIWQATKYSYKEAKEMRDYLNKEYVGYTWYVVEYNPT